MRKAKLLQAEIERLQKQIAGVGSTHINAVAEVGKSQSGIFVAAAQLAEITSRRIVYLTFVLAVLTAALLIYTIFLYQDAHTEIKNRNLTQHHQLQTPQPPESKP
jgi:hypothetical protein